MGRYNFYGRTNLQVFLNGIINAETYRHEILEPYVIPFAAQYGPEFILQQDNARPHTARVGPRYLEEYITIIMDWSANSPDLNPIEHLWDLLKRRLQSRPQAPDLQTLGENLREEWNASPQEIIRSLIQSMANPCAEVFSRGTMPTAMLETYSSCDRPPPLDKLNCYRDDGKDGLKFYTDPNYFFELWRAEMLNDTERVMHDKGKNRGHRGGRSSADGAQGGPRHKKRVRAPQNTRERQKQIAREHGEYIMPQQNTIYRTPHQIPQQYQEVDGYIPNQDQRPPRPNSIEIRRSYQRDVEHIDGLHSPTLYQNNGQIPNYDEQSLYHHGLYGQGPLSSESLYAGGTPTRSKSRPSQPPPAPPSNQGTPTSGTPTRGRIPSSGRDQLPPPPPPPEPTSPPPNGLPPHMLQHRMSESPHRSSTPELPLSPPPINHNQDLPPPPPAPTQQTLIQTKQASPPKQLAGGLNSSQVNQSAGVASPPAAPAAPPPPPPPPMPTTNIHAPPAGPMVNGDLIRALASPPKLTPVKDRVLGKLGPPLADPRNDLLKVSYDVFRFLVSIVAYLARDLRLIVFVFCFSICSLSPAFSWSSSFAPTSGCAIHNLFWQSIIDGHSWTCLYHLS
ncbi:wiskott-Aldrich syndrome protein family member 2-like [Sitophilus oryzae]|uniref:Wiskott-Aldrich syndrome protein family member n=1 Tax=Sitophilus oryzae TaxID=7048 RepID=A0A6J2XIW0_SITOR|nr:wiskott-Aldrich syndrome protein family member 2-like [Sitophilus oryzae]